MEDRASYDAAVDQPTPTTGTDVCVQDVVIADLIAGDYVDGEVITHATKMAVAADIEARKRVGVQRYGTTLRTFNGRDPSLDKYQELLDALLYARQDMLERQELLRVVEQVRDEMKVSLNSGSNDARLHWIVLLNTVLPDKPVG